VNPKSTLLTIILTITFSAFASASENNFWTQSVYFENDLFSGTDQNYTNGVKLSLISPNLSTHVEDGKIPRKLLETIHRIPFIQESGPEYTHKVEFSIGQNIYTPADIAKSELLLEDRPYSGWLYASTSYHRKNIVNNVADFMDTVEVQFGMVGPVSFAEDTQKFVHKVFDRPSPNGWHNQLDNEPGLMVIFERKWLFHPVFTGLGYDIITHTGGAIGNVSTYLNGGIEMRLGWNIPRNFGVSLIRPAGSTRLSVDDNFSIYIFGAVDGRVVLRDIFLDGNTFTDSHSVDRKTLIADLAGGLTISYKTTMLSWTYILRTKEFDNQKDNHSFGALSCSFNLPFFY
jgi:hypothetical protein